MTVTRQVVNGLYAKITHTSPTLWWCELQLSPHYRYTRRWVCTPGETKEKAIANALKQAQLYKKDIAA